MSTITSSTTSHHHQIQGRHRKYSDELDIFEATQYFSGGGTGSFINATTKFASYCAMREERHAWSKPYRKNSDVPAEAMLFEKHADEKMKKKIKQPRSPAAKLANFVNSLFFNQATSKKKPKPSKDGEEIHVERGRRRSISHSPSLRSRLWHGTVHNVRRRGDLAPSDHRGVMGRNSGGIDVVWVHEQKKTGRIIGGEDDDAGESSDSSSDLFELKNYEFGPGDGSSGLPVYGSTNMGVIKRV